MFDGGTIEQANLLAYVNLSDPSDSTSAVTKTIQNGDVFRILAQKLSITLTDELQIRAGAFGITVQDAGAVPAAAVAVISSSPYFGPQRFYLRSTMIAGPVTEGRQGNALYLNISYDFQRTIHARRSGCHERDSSSHLQRRYRLEGTNRQQHNLDNPTTTSKWLIATPQIFP